MYFILFNHKKISLNEFIFNITDTYNNLLLYFQNLQDYIDSAEHGVIYFSFGSLINLSNIPKEILNVFFTVIGRLKQKVILKWISKNDMKLPENVMIGSWLPQNDILGESAILSTQM